MSSSQGRPYVIVRCRGDPCGRPAAANTTDGLNGPIAGGHKGRPNKLPDHLIKRSRHPKPDLVDGVERLHGVANGRADVTSFVIPGTAARNVGGAGRVGVSRTVGGHLGLRCWVVVTGLIAVLDPLPHVAVHVVETPCIGWIRSDFDSAALPLLSGRKVGLIVGNGVPKCI